MNTENKTSSINFKTLIYLIVFSVSLLLVVWLAQIAFFKVFYERYQITSLSNLANDIYNNQDDLFTKLDSITFDNNTCMEYVDNSGKTIYYNNRISGCLLGKVGILDKYFYDMNNISDNITSVELVNPMNKSQALLYGIKVNGGNVYLFTMLEDVNTTTSLLKSQLIYITIIAIVLSILVSFFLSNKLSKPISDITSKAKRLADGNYDITFESSDISEINDLAETLNYLESEVSKTDEFRRDLMANVSHDLKTPLTMIKAYAEMVRDINYNNDEKRNDNLNVIIDETDRLTVLVNDILELSKLQANTTSLEKENFDLVLVLNNIIKKYDVIKETEQYEFIVKTPKKAIINADKKRINQVIYNLINNAINYTGDDKKVFVNIIDMKKYYHVEIKDTGKGIDKSDLEHIWDKYYKKDKNHKRNVVGTGLGLSIVKSILEGHQFNYGVDSTVGKGSTFYFDIPKEKK